MLIQFPLLDEHVTVDEGLSVSDACAAAGHPLNLVCGGKGTCKKCLMTIKEGGELKEILACQYPASDNMEIHLSSEQAEDQLLEATANQNLTINPTVKCYTLDRSDLIHPMCSYLSSVLKDCIPQTLKPLSQALSKKLNTLYYAEDYAVLNVIVYGDQVVDLIPNDSRQAIYGVAFDIGTTSVVGYLYDLDTGKLMGQSSMLNKQIAFGGDVISRIDYAGSSAEQLHTIHSYIMDTLTDILNKLCSETGIKTQSVYHAVYCGNSTMQHLFLELNPKHLGMSPFVGVTRDSVTIAGNELAVPINPAGFHVFMPLLGGFVGADTTAVLLGLPRDEKMRLMIDLGTNGEIAVGNHTKYYVASTACGPALEGAGIEMGMRGTTGAIEKVWMEDGNIKVKVIGGGAPKGFCGSGIIDAVALFLSEGIMAKAGNFIKGAKLEAHPLKDRLITDADNKRSFIVVPASENPDGKDIIISQKDIRAVQLAKAAIYTGCCLLTANYGIKGSDLEEIVIAGAFGNYIDIDNAKTIGLLPDVDGLPVHSIGNGAGTGAQMYLLSRDEAHFCNAIPSVVTHIELASDPQFVNTYMANTVFGDYKDL